MDTTPDAARDQAALWKGGGGRGWVEAQDTLDRVLEPFEDLLVAAVAAKPRRQVLDVGCGTGGTTVAVARLLGAHGQCTGVDISDQMIAAARARAERQHVPAGFICADAQTYAFEPGRFDMIVSRFGVMFFEDSVKAFANLRRAAADDAELWFIAWRGAEENPFMTTAERAAAPLLPNLPARRADGPGQFALADADRVRAMLAESGWTGIDIQAVDVACGMPEKELIGYLTRLGPVGRMLQDADERTRAEVLAVVRPAFDGYVHGAEVRFTAACWTVGARAPRR